MVYPSHRRLKKIFETMLLTKELFIAGLNLNFGPDICSSFGPGISVSSLPCSIGTFWSYASSEINGGLNRQRKD